MAAKTTPTERVVLRLVEEDSEGTPVPEAWAVIGTVVATSKIAAIKQLADGEPGQYRAPSLRSWKGGLEIVLPEKPKPEQRLFD